MATAGKYEACIRTAAETERETYVLNGDCLIVEEIDLKDFRKTKSGIEIATDYGRHQVNSVEAQAPVFARVLMVGAGFYNDADEAVPVDASPGDICLFGKNAIQVMSQFGKILTSDSKIGLTNASQILMRFKGQEGFDRFFDKAKAVLDGQS